MKCVRRFSLVVFAAILLVASVHAAPPNADRAAIITEIIEAAREKHEQPGIAAAVVDGREIASAVTGIRLLRQEAKIELTDRFHTGSCTKAMTATVIAMLVHEGVLAWDTRVLDVFPEAAEKAKEAYRDITLHDLLTHRAGLVSGTDGNSIENRQLVLLTGTPREQREQAVTILLESEPLAARHEKVVYSNAGFGIAAAMAERRSDTPWEQLLKDRIFTPLEMTHAGFGWPATMERRDQPFGHRVAGDRLVPLPVGSPYRLPHAITPASDVHCSIDDLARFARLHLDALRERETPLTKSCVSVLHNPRHGCGWFPLKIAGHTARWHNGSSGTFFAVMAIWPEHDLAVVVMTNAGNGERACMEIAESLFRAIRGNTESE